MDNTILGVIGARHRLDTAHAPGPASALPGLLGRLVERTGNALLRAHRRRATIDELRSLDDRTLADIGLTRDGIGHAVDGLLDRGATANENRSSLAA